MDYLNLTTFIKEEDYSKLLSEYLITKYGETYEYDPDNTIYIVKNNSVPEYAKVSGYSSEAGKARTAIRDINGNVIPATYDKKPLVIEINNNNIDNNSLEEGTYNSITQAISDGREVIIKLDNEDNISYFHFSSDDYDGKRYVFYYTSRTYGRTLYIYDDDYLEVYEASPNNHYHGNISKLGRISSTAIVTIANNDKLVITDDSASNEIKASSISFDGSTTTQALTKKGTWETFYLKPSNGIPATDLTSAIQTLLTAAGTALLPADITTLTNKVSALEDLVATDSNAVIDKFNEIVTFLNGINATDTLSGLLADIASQINAKYTKPSTGIPKSDLANDIQTSLGKADTALLLHLDISGKADKVLNATNGNFAGLDANGNLTDSGKKASDFATAAQGALADTALQSISAGDNVVINNNEISVPTFPVNKVVPIYEKTYENYTCGTTANDLYVFFGNIISSSNNWTEPWEIFYTLKVSTSNDACQGEYDVRVSYSGASVIYAIYNRFYSGPYYPIYAHYIEYHNDATKFSNRAEHPVKIGVKILSSYLPAALARTYNIKVWELRNCTFSFPENLETKTNVYNASYYAETSLNATLHGLQESGDATDTNNLFLTYSLVRAGVNGIKRYSLVMQDGDGNWLSFTTGTGGTLVTKQKNPVGFRLGSRVYYINRSTDCNANVAVDNYTIKPFHPLVDLRYSFNINKVLNGTSNNFMPYLPIYIVGHLGSDGLFYLEDMWWTLHEPTYNDGKIYIRVSEAVYPDYLDARCYRADLVSDGYAYWFKDGAFRRFYGKESLNSYSISDLEFVYRKTTDGITLYNGNKAAINNIKGNTLAWNQLLPFINIENYPTRTRINITDGIASYDSSAGTYWSWCPFISTYQINYSTKNHVYYLACYVVTNTTGYGHFSIGEADSKTFTSYFRFNGETGYKSYICTNNTEHKLFGFTLQSYPYIMTSADSLSIKDVMAIDLTLIYGSGNEPSTPEEFEADYLRWFGKPLTYEPYDAGSLRNVQMQGLKSVGFNLLNLERTEIINRASFPTTKKEFNSNQIWKYFAYNGYSQVNSREITITKNSVSSANGDTSYGVGFPIKVFPNTEYYYKSTFGAVGFFDSNGIHIGHYTYIYGTFTTPNNCEWIVIVLGRTADSWIEHNPIVNISNQTKDGTYEPYDEHNVSVPVATLTGKVNGQGESVVIFPDGMKSVNDIRDEIYVENGVTKAIKRIGRVDLGSLTWSYTSNSDLRYFYTSCLFKNNVLTINSKYQIIEWSSFVLNYGGNRCPVFAIYTHPTDGGRFNILDDNYTDAAVFKTAMSGVMCDYELAEPVEYVIDNFSLPVSYTAYKEGTEEIINTELAPILDIIYGINILDIKGLPKVSSSDNGKTLLVVNGLWALVSVPNIYTGTGVPSDLDGNDGDIYIQTI